MENNSNDNREEFSDAGKAVLILSGLVIIVILFAALHSFTSKKRETPPPSVSLGSVITEESREITSTGFTAGILRFIYLKGGYHAEKKESDGYEEYSFFKEYDEFHHSAPIHMTISKKLRTLDTDFEDPKAVAERFSLSENSTWTVCKDYYIESHFDTEMEDDHFWYIQIIPKKYDGHNYMMVVNECSPDRDLIDREMYELLRIALLEATGYVAPPYETYTDIMAI